MQNFDLAMKYVKEYRNMLLGLKFTGNEEIERLLTIQELEDFISSQKYNKV